MLINTCSAASAWVTSSVDTAVAVGARESGEDPAMAGDPVMPRINAHNKRPPDNAIKILPGLGRFHFIDCSYAVLGFASFLLRTFKSHQSLEQRPGRDEYVILSIG